MSSIQGATSAFTSRPSTRGRPAVAMREEQEVSAREASTQAAANDRRQQAVDTEAQRVSEVQASRKSEGRTEAPPRTPGSGVQMSNDMLVWMQNQ